MDRNTYYSLKTIINMRKRYAMNNLEGNLYYQNALAERQDLVDKVYEIAGNISDKEKLTQPHGMRLKNGSRGGPLAGG